MPIGRSGESTGGTYGANAAVPGAGAGPWLRVFLAAGVLGLAACTQQALINLTAPLSGQQVLGTDTINVIVRNLTPFRALFTIGSINNTDQQDVPDFQQFVVGEGNTQRLEGGGISDMFTFRCGRQLSVGSPFLIQRVRATAGDTVDERGLIVGVGYSDADFDDELGALPTAGIGPPREFLLGVDYTCRSVIIVELVQTGRDPNTFAVTATVIPPEDQI